MSPSLATTLGARAFTPGYSPPEQYGTGSTDRRSDIYALGATVYHLLTGMTPPDSIKRMLNRADMSPPRQLNDEISPNIEKIILRSTELDTDRRYQSVEELLAELRRPEGEINSPVKTEAVPHSSVATRPVEQPTPVPQLGNIPPPPIMTNAAEVEISDPVQVIPVEKRRSPVGIYAFGGVALLILTGLCVIFVFNKLYRSVFPDQVGSPIRTTLAALPITPGTPQGIKPVPATFTPEILIVITPSSTPTQESSPTPTEIPTSFAYGYNPVAQILPVETGQIVRGVAVKDNFLYLLTTGGTLDVFDISGLTATAELQTFQRPISSLQLQNGNGLLLNDPYLYAYGSAGLEVVDVSDPSIPGYMKSLTGQSIFNLALFDGYLLAPGQRYLAVYSLSQPEFPRLVSQYDAGQGYSIFAAVGYQNLLYASEFSDAGLDSLRYLVLDFSDPTDLRELGAYNHRFTAYHYHIFEDELVACANSMLEVWELSTPEKPSLVYSEPAQARVCALDSGVVVTNGSAARLEPGGFKTFSTFDPGGGQPDGFPYGSAVMGDYVFLAQSERVLVLYRNFK